MRLFLEKFSSHLTADKEVTLHPEKYFDQIIEMDLSSLEPQIAGPFTPDWVRSLSQFKEEIQTKGIPVEHKAGLIGSCTNSSYDDLCRCASIAI